MKRECWTEYRNEKRQIKDCLEGLSQRQWDIMCFKISFTTFPRWNVLMKKKSPTTFNSNTLDYHDVGDWDRHKVGGKMETNDRGLTRAAPSLNRPAGQQPCKNII